MKNLFSKNINQWLFYSTISEIKAEVEINKMVYELCNLSEEKIWIAESLCI
jgi:hypothetical protein